MEETLANDGTSAANHPPRAIMSIMNQNMRKVTNFVLAPNPKIVPSRLWKCHQAGRLPRHAVPLATSANRPLPSSEQKPQLLQHRTTKEEEPTTQARGNTLLLIGLGNPGNRFENTRHNVGFDLVTAFARRHSGPIFRVNKYIQAEHTTISVNDATVHIIKPTTFMNRSGRSVLAALKYFDLPTSALLVIADDIALDVGRLRLRARGSSGGHNGLKSVQGAVGGSEYARLKVGVGVPADARQWADFVLQGFSRADLKVLEQVEWDAMDVLDYWTREPDLSLVIHKLGQIQASTR